MFKFRILATALLACAIAVPAFAQEPLPAQGNPLKLSAGDFKHFFSADTAKTLAYVSMFAIASARTVTMSVANAKFNLGVQPQAGGASVNFTKIYR